jgi:hypothetical protein
MKKVGSDTWIQLLGMLSVLAGLVFVGLEMRQSQEKACMISVKGGTFLKRRLGRPIRIFYTLFRIIALSKL